jgi:hypothetical protein
VYNWLLKGRGTKVVRECIEWCVGMRPPCFVSWVCVCLRSGAEHISFKFNHQGRKEGGTVLFSLRGHFLFATNEPWRPVYFPTAQPCQSHALCWHLEPWSERSFFKCYKLILLSLLSCPVTSSPLL